MVVAVGWVVFENQLVKCVKDSKLHTVACGLQDAGSSNGVTGFIGPKEAIVKEIVNPVPEKLVLILCAAIASLKALASKSNSVELKR